MPAPEYHVINRRAIRQIAAPSVNAIARQIRDEVAAKTPRGPTKDYAAAWTVRPGRFLAVAIVENPTEYARYVEYGTRHMNAQPVFGRVIARWRAQPGFGSVRRRR